MTDDLDIYARDGGALTPVQEEICRRVIEGESIKRICEDEAMPTKATVFNWLQQDDLFRLAYGIATQLRGHHLFEEAIEIADQEPPRVTVQTGEERFETRVDGAAVQHAKLRVDTRKWAAGKLHPRKYGDLTRLANADGSNLDMRSGPLSAAEKFVRLAAIADEIRRRQLEDPNEDEE